MQKKEEETLEKVLTFTEECEQIKKNYVPNDQKCLSDLISFRKKCGFYKKFFDYQKKENDTTDNIEQVKLTSGWEVLMNLYTPSWKKRATLKSFMKIIKNGAKWWIPILGTFFYRLFTFVYAGSKKTIHLLLLFFTSIKFGVYLTFSAQKLRSFNRRETHTKTRKREKKTPRTTEDKRLSSTTSRFDRIWKSWQTIWKKTTNSIWRVSTKFTNWPIT